ncbi:MAG: FADH(2)-oxidizing methylenetetrahydrofolate--tRNA-(uracil(54)-C(5))-methyltransferase TrmFO [Vulcanibacillus sp.]
MGENHQAINVIGAGLAGSEAAWQIANRGISVKLYEMKKVRKTPAHNSDLFAELVCSNSLRSNNLTNAVGLLKEELRSLDSLIISSADKSALPAGGALAVDRNLFSRYITDKLRNHPYIEVIDEEVTAIPKGATIIASGPLTSDSLSKAIQEQLGDEYFYFYDAAAPIVEKESINFEKVYISSRYDKGEAAYINCPMDEEEFNLFYNELVNAETADINYFEKEIFFEGCMPIEVIGKRGKQTLLFGPMKPVGLINPKNNKEPYAVVQLRQDNAEGTLYNLVGFQTHLKWGEQKKIIRLIPGLEAAEILRYGVMHRNTYINSPKLLEPTYQTKSQAGLFFAGQITGVEGYVESTASGLVAGINASLIFQSKSPLVFPKETVIGSMAHYIATANSSQFQPMNANFGLLPPLIKRIKNKQEKNLQLSNRSLEYLNNFHNNYNI